MLTIDSRTTMEGLDLNMNEDILLMRSSRTATFTLSSSSSTSLSCSNLYNHPNGRTTTSSTVCSSLSNSYVSEHRSFMHRESLNYDSQKRRPKIHDPYQLAPNLQVLDDWMIVSLLFCCCFRCYIKPVIDVIHTIFFLYESPQLQILVDSSNDNNLRRKKIIGLCT